MVGLMAMGGSSGWPGVRSRGDELAVSGLVEPEGLLYEVAQVFKDFQIGGEVDTVCLGFLLVVLKRARRIPTNFLQAVSRWQTSSCWLHRLQSGLSEALKRWRYAFRGQWPESSCATAMSSGLGNLASAL